MKFLKNSCFKPEPFNDTDLKSTSCAWCPVFGQKPEPSHRSHHAVCVYGNKVFMYGGRSGKGTMSDFWIYDAESLAWKQVCQGEVHPPPLEGHTMIVYEQNIYMFGGETSFASADESPLWQFNIAESRWSKILVKNVLAPCGRRHHTAVLYMNAMYVYAGYQDLIGPTKEMWIFHFETNSWHYDMAASADTAPEARYGHCSVVSNHSMWVCGGFTGLKPQSDVNVWDFELRMWSAVKSRGGPSELSGHSACLIDNEMYVFGGHTTTGTCTSEMWRLSLSNTVWKKCHYNAGIKPPAISGHCMITLQPDVNSKGLRTSSMPDMKTKHQTNEKIRARPKTQESIQHPVPYNQHTNFRPPLQVAPVQTESKETFKYKLLSNDEQINVGYHNPLLVSIENSIDLGSLPSELKSQPHCEVNVTNNTKTNGIDVPLKSGFDRGTHLNLPVRNPNICSFSYNLIRDVPHEKFRQDLDETSFIQLPDKRNVILSEVITRKKIAVPRSAEHVLPTVSQGNVQSSAADDTIHVTDAWEGPIDIDYTVFSSNAEELQKHCDTRDYSRNKILFVLGGRVADINPNFGKSFCMWECRRL